MSQATLDARLRLNSADFHGGLNRASRDARQAASDMSSSFGGMRNMLTAGLGMAFGTNAVKAIIDARIQVESLQAAMTATMGNAALGQQTFEQIKQLSGDIGLGVSEAAKSFIQLQSAGMKTADAFKMIRAGYNAIVSTGGGAAEFSRFAIAIQQLRNSPKPLQEEINQLREALPITSKLMQEAFGVQRAEDLQKLGVSGREFVDTIGEMLGKLPQVGNTLGKEVARLSTVWTDFKASLGDSLLGDVYQGGLNVIQELIGIGKMAKEGLQAGVEMAFGVYDPNAKKKLAQEAAQAQENLDNREEAAAPFGKLTPEDMEEWKKANEKWRAERKQALEKAANDEKEFRDRVERERVEAVLAKIDEEMEEYKQAYQETVDEVKRMEEAALAEAQQKQIAFEGLAQAKEMLDNKLSENINEGIQKRLQTRSERRAEADEKRRFEKAKNSEEAALAKKILKEERDAFKKNEFENLKKGNLWNEEKAKLKARADAQDAVRKATEDGTMTLKDILTTLKTLATA